MHDYCLFFSAVQVARRAAVAASTKGAAKRAAVLQKMAAGQPTGAPKKTATAKKVAKDFYKSLLVDSGYQGEDYDEFATWLGA
jgi:hypothetical protein